MPLLAISRTAYRQTSIRVLKKLLAVLAGVLAFYGLRVMENWQGNYESKRSEPIIIVDNLSAAGNDQGEYSIAIDRTYL